MDEDEELDHEPKKVAIDAAALHLVTPQEAIRIFDAEIGSGSAWSSPLMQYRTTAGFQEDWKLEVGNWIERARRLGYLGDLRRNVIPHQQVVGDRSAGDAVHRNVMQQLAQAQMVHYLVGTGWGFHVWEPAVAENRGSGIAADVDVQLAATNGPVVDFQVKASGKLGLDDRIVDDHIQKGICKAAAQLPTPATRPALIAVLAQRSWPLTASVDVVERFIGSSACYPDGAVLLHDRDCGEFVSWPHVSGIVVLDHRRGLEDSDYGCVLIQNPWAARPVDPAWFPHARVLTSANGAFSWLRGRPAATTLPDGATFFRGTSEDALRDHGRTEGKMKHLGWEPTSNPHCWQTPDGHIISERAPVAWIDTNVTLEVHTFGDIMEAKRKGTSADVESRRIRMQGTLWFATVLCAQQAVTITYSHEGARNLGRMCPPGSDLRAWSGTILFVLGGGGLFDGWMDGVTSAGAQLSNRKRDAYMIEACRRGGMVLITRDAKAAKEAEAAGVAAEAPEEYAVKFMPRSLAYRMFMQRLVVATNRYVEKGPPAQREQWVRNMIPVRKVYEYIWKPTGPAEPFSAEALFR